MKYLLALLFICPFLSNGQIINTFAGNGISTYAGDGGPATSAQINEPSGLAFDKAGNTYIMDQYNYRIRKVSALGIITTIAGTGVPGYSGDGGLATSAQFARSINIATDTFGNLYFTDGGNNRIRRISSSGIITTVAGTGIAGYSGDGGMATLAKLNSPTGLAVDNTGNLYIADDINYVIRKVSTSGIITTVAGNATPGYSGDGGPATLAQLNQIFAVTVDNLGNLYLSDQLNQRIRKVSISGMITTFAGNGTAGFSGDGLPATAAQLNFPAAVAIDISGNIYIADQVNNRVREVSTSGIITSIAGNGSAGYSGDGGAATIASINATSEINISPSGVLCICDNNNNRIRVLSTCTSMAITSQPTPDTVKTGTNAVFTVATSMPSPSYQWQENPGSGFVNLANVWPYSGVKTNSLTIHNASIYLDTTNYRCIISNASFCRDTSASAILVINTSLSNIIHSIGQINLFPNPVNKNLTVQLSGINNFNYVELINQFGQIVSKQKFISDKLFFDMGDLPSGIYILKIQSEENTIYKKIIKN
jgi:hypothetical protein